MNISNKDFSLSSTLSFQAILHFKANIDADDIEICLGTAAVVSIGNPRKTSPF